MAGQTAAGPSPIGAAIQGRIANAINPPPRPAPAAASSAGPFVTRAQLQRGVPVVSTLESVKLMGGAFAGAALAALLIAKVFPTQRTLTSIGVGVGGSILAASSPPTSLAENVGLGAAIGSALFLLLDLTGQITPPPASSAGLARRDAPPTAAPSSSSRLVALRGLH